MTTDTALAPMAQPSHADPAPFMGPMQPLPIIATTAEQSLAPMMLDLMELELALDLNDIAELGFSQAVRQAAKTIGGEFLFDLPASGLVDNAQRIAVVCLSRTEPGRFGLVLLDADGDRAITLEPDAATADLVQFAKAFVSVLEKL
ncbi:hypothetical protein OEG84_23365 [Hoeflea sp. G2-23]|uniref:Uncharacterized protein n=1 Tax=Hoeflea algicola TaxID=2983763 RepID=A0ABT3ZH82_9HYPH|nr:hypothetical protein [Hoeflea algicola]MCY0150561.1 hypothetical protein [Hoeflea algicola]